MVLQLQPGGVRVGSARCDPYWCERLAPWQACQNPRAAPMRAPAPKRSRGVAPEPPEGFATEHREGVNVMSSTHLLETSRL